MKNLTIDEIQIAFIPPHNGLVGFATAIINEQFKIGNISIYTSPKSALGYRLVFPNKKLASGQVIDCFHPINREAEQQVTSAIVKRYLELMSNFHHAEVD